MLKTDVFVWLTVNCDKLTQKEENENLQGNIYIYIYIYIYIHEHDNAVMKICSMPPIENFL